MIVATHDNRILPLADRLVEMVPEFATKERPAETVRPQAGEVLFEQGMMGDLIEHQPLGATQEPG